MALKLAEKMSSCWHFGFLTPCGDNLVQFLWDKPQHRNGTDGAGRRQGRFFTDRSEAEKHSRTHDHRPLSVDGLWERKLELLYNLERLRTVNTNLTDVVTLFLNHQESVTGQQKLFEVIDEFLRVKIQSGRSQRYDRTMRQHFGRFTTFIKGDEMIGNITREIITDYVYVKHKHVGPVTKRNLL